MATSKKDAIDTILHCSGSRDKKLFESALQNLQQYFTNEGLNERELEELVKILTSRKIASDLGVKLFHSLIPETTVSNKVLKELLSWFFSEVGSGRISHSLEKQFINWITGIVHYELGDLTVIDKYYYSFLFLLSQSHMEAVISKLLCLISKPEDAKRFTVLKVLKIQKKSGPKAHTNSLLSILKSFRSDVVPEYVPQVRLNYENSSFHDNFQKAHERKINSTNYNSPALIDLSWNQFKHFNINNDHNLKKSRKLDRLIPTSQKINFESSMMCQDKKTSVTEIKNMISLGVHYLHVEIPSQTLSLLRNVVGFHVLAFSDEVTKSRFCHKLYHTLFRVFVLELEPYATSEKVMFLDSIVKFQEYIQQGIPVVTEFLLYYLLIWDGEEFREQILNMLQWVVITNERDWREFFFRPIQQIFRSSGLHCKYLIIEALGSLLRNVIAFHGKKKFLFYNDRESNKIKLIEDLAGFVKELIVEGLIWTSEAGRRVILSASLNFYEICTAIEYSEDFPAVITMPPALVYGCLLSGSRVLVARFCSLIIKFWQNTIEKLLFFGHVQSFNTEFEKTRIYLLDFYRCLWSNTDFKNSEDSFMFNQKGFSALFWEFRDCLGINLKNILSVDKNITFWNGKEDFPQDGVNLLAVDYPSIVSLKHLCEEQVL